MKRESTRILFKKLQQTTCVLVNKSIFADNLPMEYHLNTCLTTNVSSKKLP